MFDWYVHLPSLINPVAFSIGFFEMRWYALLYMLGFFSVWAMVVRRVRKREEQIALGDLWDVGVWIFFGGIFGGRMGWVLLYGKVASFSEFLSSFLPWDSMTGVWTGWYGMSFFGAIVGSVVFGILAAKRKNISFLAVADVFAPFVPLGIFFGRIGNFVNGEILGRETENFLGMSFYGTVRHPSQLYEAVLEGLVVFFLLWRMRKRKMFPGASLAFLGMGYAVARFCAEFFRDEPAYAGVCTQGQVYAAALFFAALLWLWWKMRKSGIFICNE